jgi:hypothetical protein
MNFFSFKEYRKIFYYYKSNLKLLNFNEVNKNSNNFFILRHDVEFSIERAFDLALFEKWKLNTKSNFFFQLKNNSYNLLSYENIKMVNEIIKMGHGVGLHFNYKGPKNKKLIISELNKQKKIFFSNFKKAINFFSPHRPSKNRFLLNLNLPNFKNTYLNLYFTPYEKAINNVNKTLYLVDSRHKWKFIHPLNVDLKKHRKIQLVFHPDAWTKKGYNLKKNYSNLKKEKNIIFKETLFNETDYIK